LGGADALHVHGSGPTLAHEVQLCDELVGPACDDGLPGGVARRMVVVAALGAGFRIASGPHARVHGVDGRRCSAPRERMSGEQFPQSFGVYLPSVQRGVKATPAATMGRLEAQVNGRRNAIRSEESVGELEESIGSTVEAFVERTAEGLERIGRFHDAPIMRSPRGLRILRHQRS
jgi:hypothetical protein